MSMLLDAMSSARAEDRGNNPVHAEARTPGRLKQSPEIPRSSPSDQHALDLDSEETLVVDARADLSPAQMVEQKLLVLLRDKALPVSYLQKVYLPRTRS